MMKKIRVTLFLTDDLAKLLKKMAIDANLSVSKFIEKLVNETDKKHK